MSRSMQDLQSGSAAYAGFGRLNNAQRLTDLGQGVRSF